MKEQTLDTLNQIDKAHDWRIGQAYSSGGTETHGADQCRLCALIRQWRSDHAAHSIEYSFNDGEKGGVELSLRQAHARGCGLETS